MILFTSSKGLPPPVVDGLLDDDPRWDETGLLKVTDPPSDLNFTVPAWDYQPLPSLKTVLEIDWDGETNYRKEWDDSVTSLPEDDLSFVVPSSRLEHGTHTLCYTVTTALGNRQHSATQTITVDQVAPTFGADHGRLDFDTSVITAAYLGTHNDQVEGRIVSYNGGKPGDVVTWYWSSDPFSFGDAQRVSTRTLERGDFQSPSRSVMPRSLWSLARRFLRNVIHRLQGRKVSECVDFMALPKPITLIFPGKVIRDSKDGKRYAFCNICDRAGNPGPYSQPVEFEVTVEPAPRDLPPPELMETSGSNSSTLDPMRATGGVRVQIPEDAVINPGETVWVQWGDPGSVGCWRTDETESGLFRIPSTRIAQHFGKQIPVYYEVFEPGVDLPHVSQNHWLTVSEISGFPTVQCDKAANGSPLRLGSIEEGGRASFTLERWTFMHTDQLIDIRVEGVDAYDAGALVVVTVLENYQVPVVAQKIDAGYITKTDLRRFKVDQTLSVKVKVSFDEGFTWQPFPMLRPLLSQ